MILGYQAYSALPLSAAAFSSDHPGQVPPHDIKANSMERSSSLSESYADAIQNNPGVTISDVSSKRSEVKGSNPDSITFIDFGTLGNLVRAKVDQSLQAKIRERSQTNEGLSLTAEEISAIKKEVLQRTIKKISELIVDKCLREDILSKWNLRLNRQQPISVEEEGYLMLPQLIQKRLEMELIESEVGRERADPAQIFIQMSIQTKKVEKTVLTLDLTCDGNEIADREWNTWLHVACIRGLPEVVEGLIQNDKTLNLEARNEAYETPLLAAMRLISDPNHTPNRVFKKNLVKVNRILQILIHAGAQVNVSDNKDPSKGLNPITKAATYGNLETVTIILKAGAFFKRADLAKYYNSEEFYFDTPLFTALKANQPEEVIRAFIQAGDDPLYVNRTKRNALHYAAYFGGQAICYLLSCNVDFKQQDKDGETPLHHASAQGNLDAAILLIQAGSDCKAENLKNETPLKVFSLYLKNNANLISIKKEKDRLAKILILAKLFIEKGAIIDRSVKENFDIYLKYNEDIELKQLLLENNEACIVQ